ncbi:amino acid permease [Geodermatophilus sp. SYSU D01119]
MDLFRTKSVEAVRADAGEGDGAGEGADGAPGAGHLRKRLSARHLVGFGIGIVIGTGIFTLTGVTAKNTAGPAVVVSFALAGLVALLAAVCYAELASAVPTAGSAYTYTYATAGEVVAWIIGWDLFLEFALGAAVVARGWSGYVGNLFDLPPSLFGETSTVNLGAAAVVVVLTLVAVLGIRESARVTALLVVVKVAVCVFVIGVGAWFVLGDNLSPFVPPSEPAEGGSGLTRPLIEAIAGLEPVAFGVGGVVTAAAVVFFAYTGFEAVANLSEETRRPARDVPLGLLGTLGLATALYVGVAFVVVGMVQYTDIDEGAPIADAFDQVGLGWASSLVSIAAVAGLTSVILVDLITIGRIGFAMGRDGLLPPSVARISPRSGVPARVTLLFAVLVLVLATFVPLGTLADLVSIGTLFAFLLVAVAVPVLRRTRPELPRPFRVPFSPVVPALAALACLYLMLNLSIETWLRFLAWLALGMVVYAVYGYRHSRVRAAARAETTAR